MTRGGQTVAVATGARTSRGDGVLELVLTGLAHDQDELLGDLTEARADVAHEQGERAARRWWRRQAVTAAARLAWHGLAHRPLAWVLGAAGFVLWALLGSLVPTPFVGDVEYDMGPFGPRLPSVGDVVADTVVVGLGTLLAAALAGAAVATLARRERLVPVLVTAALMVLISTRAGFHVVYGPGTCERDVDGTVLACSIELGALSRDAIVPAAWQLPTMMVLLPLATLGGALAVVALVRRRCAALS